MTPAAPCRCAGPRVTPRPPSGASAAMAAILPILLFVVVVAVANRLEFGSFD